MSGKASELSDKDASDQLITGGGESANVIGAQGSPVPVSEKQPEIQRPIGRGFGHTRFDDVAPNPNDRRHVGEDPTGEQNRKLLEEHQAKVAEREKGSA